MLREQGGRGLGVQVVLAGARGELVRWELVALPAAVVERKEGGSWRGICGDYIAGVGAVCDPCAGQDDSYARYGGRGRSGNFCQGRQRGEHIFWWIRVVLWLSSGVPEQPRGGEQVLATCWGLRHHEYSKETYWRDSIHDIQQAWHLPNTMVPIFRVALSSKSPSHLQNVPFLLSRPLSLCLSLHPDYYFPTSHPPQPSRKRRANPTSTAQSLWPGVEHQPRGPAKFQLRGHARPALYHRPLWREICGSKNNLNHEAKTYKLDKSPGPGAHKSRRQFVQSAALTTELGCLQHASRLLANMLRRARGRRGGWSIQGRLELRRWNIMATADEVGYTAEISDEKKAMRAIQ
ncbi:hypothetical protein M409DRAFT_57362 [Zasmidium cellare ATCC 36951]|uniref:Uncharacterized protein n=1 Tax=Zasmidium cellare ATCC 36951 TaxID=1080233 RepID=A0A6A6CDE1_ZASCE|nr:uncharacterized protein M409DRAFT_57362 [Zasmidium cellare ATCC 36951]KAF2163456.1 hypothetical protein M409DRAFT_57362 [Zasmidium cellare ATCC 36951]